MHLLCRKVHFSVGACSFQQEAPFFLQFAVGGVAERGLQKGKRHRTLGCGVSSGGTKAEQMKNDRKVHLNFVVW